MLLEKKNFTITEIVEQEMKKTKNLLDSNFNKFDKMKNFTSRDEWRIYTV